MEITDCMELLMRGQTMNIKISIIVPTHNSEKFIRECIESIMHQTYENIEILCVDSSNDSTLSILQELEEQDSRLRIIQDSNGSYGHKINVGIQQAIGEYIGIVESDDYICSNMYTDMLAMLDKQNVDFIKSNALHFGLVKGSRVFCSEKKTFLDGYYNRVIDLEGHRDIAIAGKPTIWTALYRREFLLENQIWLNETPGASYQDTAFVILVGLMAKNCIFDNHAYYCYRRDNENSSVLSKDKVDYVRREYEYVVHYLQEHKLYTKEIAELLRRRKLVTYNWNCLRLSDELAEVFIASISHEMEEYCIELVAGYTEQEQEIYKLLTGECSIREYRQKVEGVHRKVEQLLETIDKTKHFVLVGAGKIGKKVLKLQEYIGDRFIYAVADNGEKVIGVNVDDYQVMKVEDAIQMYPYHTYIVANRNHAEDIEMQLILLGIRHENIICIKAFPTEDALLMKCIEYYK